MTSIPSSFHRFGAAIRRGDASRSAGRFREAVEAYTDALVVRGDDLTPDQEADLRVRIAECFLELGDLDSADVVVSPAERLDPRRMCPGTHGALRTARARLSLYRGRPADAVAAAGDAWEILRDTGENVRVARALSCRGHGHRQLGNLEAAHADYLDAMAAARRAGDDHELALASANLGSLLWLSGRYHEARAHHRRAVELHEACGKDVHLARELFALAIDEFHAGDWPQAEALLGRCAEVASRVHDAWLASVVRIAVGRLELVRGRDPRATLEEARRLAEGNGHDHDLVVIGQLLGEASMARGDWSEARRQLADALSRARKGAADSEPAADVAWRLARTEEALGDPDGRVLELLETALRTATARGFRVVEGLVRRTLGEVLGPRGRASEALSHLEESVAIFRDLKLPYETARSLETLGEHVARTSSGEAATSALREADAIFRDLGAARDGARAAEALASATGEMSAVDAGEPFAAIVTASPLVEEAIARARRIARSDLPVLLVGETGTGKELFARAIHRASARGRRPFLAVNCAALSETLLESELFGHEKGSFTGAIGRRSGIFEAATGGTVFLDEIAKAPLSLQAKLLRVLDTGEVRRVGGVEAVQVGVRIVAATNRPLDALVTEGAFLPDLLWRLRGFEIRVAPLRERPEDVALLFEKFAGRPASGAALEVLESHDWPGNIRELRNLAESAAFLSPGRGPIPLDALPDWIRRVVVAHFAEVASLEESERDAIEDALAAAAGNRSRAAKALGISRQTLYTKMSKYGIGRIGRADAA
ncbi:MAG: sigma 54-interacting transcriptional regulator [bacterium]